MRFIAKNIKGERVEGSGIAKSAEDKINGREVSYLFTSNVEWVDGTEFNVSDFELVYADTVSVIVNSKTY